MTMSRTIAVLFSFAFVSVRVTGSPISTTETSHWSPTKGDWIPDITTVFKSKALPLAHGEVVFTEPEDTILEMPPGKIAITGFHAIIVDGDDAPVSLNEVYNHHWLIFNNRSNSGKEESNSGMCQPGFLRYIFGGGAEMAKTPVIYPAPYAYITEEHEKWTANIHLLRTTQLNTTASSVKNCIECGWSPYKQAQNPDCQRRRSGGFACCRTGSFCEVNTGVDPDVTDYHLRYEVTWHPVEASDIPLEIYVLDVTQNAHQLGRMGKCEVEYNIPGSLKVIDDTVHTGSSWSLPSTFSSGFIVSAYGHLHIGGLNISLSHQPSPQSNGTVSVPVSTIMTSYPTYGTALPQHFTCGTLNEHIGCGKSEARQCFFEGCDNTTKKFNDKWASQCRVDIFGRPSYPELADLCGGCYPQSACAAAAKGIPGNEKGYVTHISSWNGSVAVSPGDSLFLNAYYSVDAEDPRGLPNCPGGDHGGVMGLMYIAVASHLANEPAEVDAMPEWAWVLIGVGVVTLVGMIILLVVRLKKRGVGALEGQGSGTVQLSTESRSFQKM